MGPVDLEGVAAHVRGQRAVGAVHVGVRAGVRDDGEFGGRDGERGDPPQVPNLRRGGHEDGRFAAFLGEQRGGVDAPGGSRRGDAARVQGGVQLPQRPQEPRQQVADVDGFADSRGHRRVDPPVADRRGGGRVGEQVPQRCHRLLCPGQALLELRQVVGDEPVAGCQVRGAQYRLDLLDRHLEVAEPADDLRHRYLVRGVAPVSGVRGRLEPVPAAGPCGSSAAS